MYKLRGYIALFLLRIYIYTYRVVTGGGSEIRELVVGHDARSWRVAGGRASRRGKHVERLRSSKAAELSRPQRAREVDERMANLPAEGFSESTRIRWSGRPPDFPVNALFQCLSPTAIVNFERSIRLFVPLPSRCNPLSTEVTSSRRSDYMLATSSTCYRTVRWARLVQNIAYL